MDRRGPSSSRWLCISLPESPCSVQYLLALLTITTPPTHTHQDQARSHKQGRLGSQPGSEIAGWVGWRGCFTVGPHIRAAYPGVGVGSGTKLCL